MAWGFIGLFTSSVGRLQLSPDALHVVHFQTVQELFERHRPVLVCGGARWHVSAQAERHRRIAFGTKVGRGRSSTCIHEIHELFHVRVAELLACTAPRRFRMSLLISTHSGKSVKCVRQFASTGAHRHYRFSKLRPVELAALVLVHLAEDVERLGLGGDVLEQHRHHPLHRTRLHTAFLLLPPPPPPLPNLRQLWDASVVRCLLG